MNSSDARKILIACRPGTDDLRDPAVAAALELARRDPELQAWWEQQQAFQHSARESFRGVRPPGHLRDKILARAKIIEVPRWRCPVALSAAAAIVLLIAVVAVWQKPSRENSFQTFRSRMVGNVLRQYSMTIQTNDMAEIRRHLDAANAPANYVLPQNLAQLPAIGAGVLSWQDQRVSMLCLDSGAQGTVFVFVVNASSVKGAPVQRDFAPVKSMATVSWTEDGKTYVLAGSGSEDGLRRQLQ